MSNQPIAQPQLHPRLFALLLALLTALTLALPAHAQGGDTITAPDTNGNVGEFTSLVLDSNGYPVISYFDHTNNDLKVMHCNDANCAGDDESITAPATDGDVGRYNSLALDSNGYPVISYVNTSNNQLQVLHCNDVNCDPAVNGAESITIPDSRSGISFDTSLMLDSSGYPVISYTDAANANLQVMHCNDANCDPNVNGGESIIAVDSEGVVGRYHKLTLDSNGYPVVSYLDDTNSALKLLHCNDANCDPTINGAESITIPDMDGIVGEYSAIALDGNGYPVISYYDRTNGDLKLLHCNDANCDANVNGAESIIAFGTVDNIGWYTSLVLDSNGYPVVSYSAAMNGDLEVMHCNDVNCDPTVNGTESVNDPDQAGSVGWDTSLALDSNGYPVVSYYDSTNGDLKLLHCNDANCANATPVADADSYSTAPDTTLAVAAPGVLTNDSDTDGDPLTAVLVNNVSNGTLALNADGSFTYVPNASFTGSDSFTYSASDGLATSASTTVTLAVALDCPAFPISVTDTVTLNHAIACFNASTPPGSYVINLNADITLAAATTPIANSSANVALQISGNAHIIDGAANHRHFTINAGAVTIADITLQNGGAEADCLAGPSGLCGGAIKVTGSANVTVRNTTITGSKAFLGSGLFNEGGTVTLTDSTLQANLNAYHGGGIYNSAGTLRVENSSILDHSADVGSGIFNENGGSLTLLNSTIASNHAASGAGALYSASGTIVTIGNSTISNNSAGNGNPGSGAYAGIDNEATTMLIYNSIIVENQAGSIGGLNTNSGQLTVRNTIIANNSGGDCGGVLATDADATNLNGDGTCGDAMQPTQLNLGPLQDNGGPTWTHALLSGSDAINAGDNTICAAVPVNNLDQRGVSRPQGSNCDIGAFEAATTTLQGDINGDGAVNVLDLQLLINMILHGTQPDATLYDLDWWSKADLNHDAAWNVVDLQLLINLIQTQSVQNAAVVPSIDDVFHQLYLPLIRSR